MKKLLLSIIILLSSFCIFGQSIGDTITLNGGGKLRDSCFIFSEPSRVLLEGTQVIILTLANEDGYYYVKTNEGYLGYMHATWIKWPMKKIVPITVPKSKKR
jgi:hypothetical protein